MKNKSYFFCGMIMLALAILPGGAGSAEVTQVALASTSSSSGYYSWGVALATVANKYATGVNVTTVATAIGGMDMAKQIRKGVFDWAAMSMLATPYEMYYGSGSFKGDGWDQIRLFCFREITVNRIYVRVDSGVKSWSDLAGKRINPGQPASQNVIFTTNINEVLGTGVRLVQGSVGDATNGIKEGRLVGMNKSSPPDRFDSAMLEVQLTNPLIVIGFSEDQIVKIRAKYPIIVFKETPAGYIKELPNLGRVNEIITPAVTITSTRMAEDVGYRIIKALHKNWGEVVKAFPPVGGYDPIADIIKTIPQGMEVPLHAGVVRYAREVGIKVPPAFIPPEYQGFK